MRKSFLEFVSKRNINEGFSEKNLEKAIGLIKNILKKNISGKLIELPGFANIKVGKDELRSKQFIVSNKNRTNVININWTKSSKSNEVYSIDIFDSAEVLMNKQSKANISIYTLGASIVYFLPAIWNIVNTGKYNVSEEIITDWSKKIFKDTKIKESYFYIGALKYRCIENLDMNIIKETFELNEVMGPDDEVRQYKKDKHEAAKNAYLNRHNSPEDNDKFKQLQAEYEEVSSAIAGGAFSIKDLRMAIKKNINVINELDDKLQEVENKFKEEREDPEMVFKKMSGYIKMVIKGINPSLIICGAPGVGKTFRVRKQLKENGYEEGKNLFTIKGKCTPRRLYLALYDYKDKGDMLLIDDADVLVGPNAPEDCINILKAALDSTSDEEGRLISYDISGKIQDDDGHDIPKRFYYNGGVIVMTNWNAGKLDTALRGRSYIQDINFTVEENLQIIEKLMPDIEQGSLSSQSKLKAFKYLKEMADAKAEMEISIRTFGICAKIFEATMDDDDFSDEDAKSMIREQMKLQASRIEGRGNTGKY